MKQLLVILTLFIPIFLNQILEVLASWDKLITSKSYENARLVTETENPFQVLNMNKACNTIVTTRIICSKNCVNNSTCVGFNFYSTTSNYVCEFLVENFCSNRQRIALQQWPGGTVWDKLSLGMTKACIDRTFENKSGAALCETGRSGCRSTSNSSQTWPDCNICVRTCFDCFDLYNQVIRSVFNCTLWPEGSSQTPIFGFCGGRSTFLIRKKVNMTSGRVSTNYRMNFRDMNRLCKLQFYKQLQFVFTAPTKYYSAGYQDFYISENGTLSNMTTTLGHDGFNIGSTPLKPSPWIESNSDCGSFWLLNSTKPISSLQCPGGDINIFGPVNVKYAQTGIHWPRATQEGKVLDYVSVKMSF